MSVFRAVLAYIVIRRVRFSLRAVWLTPLSPSRRSWQRFPLLTARVCLNFSCRKSVSSRCSMSVHSHQSFSGQALFWVCGRAILLSGLVPDGNRAQRAVRTAVRRIGSSTSLTGPRTSLRPQQKRQSAMLTSSLAMMTRTLRNTVFVGGISTWVCLLVCNY